MDVYLHIWFVYIEITIDIGYLGYPHEKPTIGKGMATSS